MGSLLADEAKEFIITDHFKDGSYGGKFSWCSASVEDEDIKNGTVKIVSEFSPAAITYAKQYEIDRRAKRKAWSEEYRRLEESKLNG